MSLDQTALRLLRTRENFYKHYRNVPEKVLEDSTGEILKLYKRYFERCPDADFIDPPSFLSLYKQWNPSQSKEDAAYYERVLTVALTAKVPPNESQLFLDGLVEGDLSRQVTALVVQYEAGDDIDIIREIESLVIKANDALEREHSNAWIDADISELLDMDANHEGIEWRLRCIREHTRPLQSGDWVIVAGRPDSGKTTFLCSELTHMAPQIKKYYKADRPIIWLNNEGPGIRIKPRLYQAALDCAVSGLIKKRDAGTLLGDYRRAVDGIDRIKVYDIHGKWNWQVEEIIQSERPGIIVYDMIDNIRFRGSSDAARTDQILEQQYQWGRELLVKYDAIGICTSQISAEGDGMLYPAMSMLKDSKTGKQGTADLQVMIGHSLDPMMQHLRGIGLVKNKLQVEGKPKDCRTEVIFDGLRARYRDNDGSDNV